VNRLPDLVPNWEATELFTKLRPAAPKAQTRSRVHENGTPRGSMQEAAKTARALWASVATVLSAMSDELTSHLATI